ncbi:Nif11-like leader peptide family RiPP precursor [Desulforhopalus sp. 52FAK]
MSIESAKDFYEKIQKDAVLAGKLEAAAKEDRQQMIKDAGFDFTKAEMQEVAAANAELSADDLANVTGGSTSGWVNTGATVAGAVASAF